MGRAPANSVNHAGLTDCGRVRKTNEDRWFADPVRQLYLVTDGMGGEFAGELASRIVAETLFRRLRTAIDEFRDLPDLAVVDRAKTAISDLSNELREESKHQPGLDGMGATVVMALVRGTNALVLHLGDSRAYLIRDTNLEQLTKDHTIVRLLVEAGKISRDEVNNHPARGQLTRYVGMAEQAVPEARLVALQANDRLLLCSDGLTGMLSDDELRTILLRELNPDAACRCLIDAANEAGGEDNCTALIVAA